MANRIPRNLTTDYDRRTQQKLVRHLFAPDISTQQDWRYWHPDSPLLEYIIKHDPEYGYPNPQTKIINTTTATSILYIICATKGLLALNDPLTIIPDQELLNATRYRIFNASDILRIIKEHTQTIPAVANPTRRSEITQPLNLTRQTLQDMNNNIWNRRPFLDTDTFDNDEENVIVGPHLLKCLNNIPTPHVIKEVTHWTHLAYKCKLIIMTTGQRTHNRILTTIIKDTPLGDFFQMETITPEALTHILRCHTIGRAEGRTMEELVNLQRLHGHPGMNLTDSKGDASHFTLTEILLVNQRHWIQYINMMMAHTANEEHQEEIDSEEDGWTSPPGLEGYPTTEFEDYNQSDTKESTTPDTEEENSLASEGPQDFLFHLPLEASQHSGNPDTTDTGPKASTTPQHKQNETKQCTKCNERTKNPTHCTTCWNNKQAGRNSTHTRPKKKSSPAKARREKTPRTQQEETTTLDEEHPEDTTPKCIICLINPINAGFLHGKTTHIVTCYTCAKKTKSRNPECPICRRKIDKIIKTFTKAQE